MVVAVGRDDAIFGAPREMGDRRPGQPLRKVGGKRAPQIGSEVLTTVTSRCPSKGARPRTVVSTSGSSGISRQYLQAFARAARPG